MVKSENMFSDAHKKTLSIHKNLNDNLFHEICKLCIKRKEEIKLGTFSFFSFTYRATFTPRIRNQPSTCIHGRPEIGIKQKNSSNSY